jgi:tyrosinase
MALTRLLVGLLAAVNVVLAAPQSQQSRQDVNSCTNPRIRKPWHKLSADEKKAYIDAELCLMKAPAKLGIRGAKTRFDELQSVHILQSEIRHFTGSFLPFHRLMMWAHEELLINDCGYKGAQV